MPTGAPCPANFFRRASESAGIPAQPRQHGDWLVSCYTNLMEAASSSFSRSSQAESQPAWQLSPWAGAAAGAPSSRLLLHQLAHLGKRFDQAMTGWSGILDDVLLVRELSARIVELVRAYPEICLGMANRLIARSTSICHDFHVAVVAVLTAQAMDLDVKQQLTVVRAALAMNLCSFKLHEDLSFSHQPLTLAQRVNLARHPLLAAELLSHTPGADLRWIEAVEQHHESMDGSGYPFGLAGKDISIEARVVKAADLWCALVTPRATRQGKHPHHAMLELQERERMRVDMMVLATMRRRLGNYPPGTLVRLANRESAMVTGFALGNSAPRHVVAIFNAAGEVLARPMLRDTGKTSFAIRSYANAPQFQTQGPDWERVWSLVRSTLAAVPEGARIA